MPSEITSTSIETPRLTTHVRSAGDAGRPTIVLIHGNASSSVFWEDTMSRLAEVAHVVAPDMRGFGDSEGKPVDATRGLRDFSDDLHALLTAQGLVGDGRAVHLVGWSVGGSVVMQYAIDHADDVASLVLINPGSPFGFGGTKDVRGTPCYADFAGSGGGTANPEFVKLIQAGDRGNDSQVSPRNVMNAFYFKPPFRAPSDQEDAFVDGILKLTIGPDNYPGDLTTSGNWPGVAPGGRGVNNTISPKHCNLSGFADISPRPPVLWIRGADDQIVSDRSMFDFGVLGELGFVPGWPGASVFPAQPMVSQTRYVLDAYANAGGRYEELVFDNCGHSPHIEHPEQFDKAVRRFLGLG
ncbi:MAG: alpha/beta hydrolase [Myxococcales bacterium]|nr:alpha/beta hydrolase [Myxococcales bacterium]MCB9748675.1 alpha/beta hydrolase [Myxococcales bacterium]